MLICVNNPAVIGSVNGLSSGLRQAIIWTSAGILLIEPSGTIEILTKIYTFSFRKVHLKMPSGKWQPFVLYLSALKGTAFFRDIKINYNGIKELDVQVYAQGIDRATDFKILP